MKKINLIINIFYIFFCLLFAGSFYLKTSFTGTSFEQNFYSLVLDTQGTPLAIFLLTAVHIIFFSSIFIILLFLPFVIKKVFNKSIPNNIINIIKIVFILIFIGLTLFDFRVFEYINHQQNNSSIYEEEYVDPSSVKIDFKEKRNLIYIYVESMESTFNDITLDDKKVSLIPDLETIANESINFSNTNDLGGALEVYGVSWTKAADVAMTSGITTQISFTDGNFLKEYKNSYKGAKALGEILEENGYKNYLLMGSEPTFAGTQNYFKSHGNYEITSLDQAIQKGYLKKGYYKNWGIEDKDVLGIAKKELAKIASKGEPFNYTIFTIDTHFPGYVSSGCPQKFDDSYANSIYCDSMMLTDFVNWVKNQDFYNDTTIIITGDHLTMENASFIKNIKREKRTVFNTFINTKLDNSTSKNRLFSTLDMYPTTLVAMGAKIEGERLGLGTNLFSGKKTLIEKYGFNHVNNELKKKSNYYNKYILK